MTEEQKLQWLQGLIAKGLNVAQINLGDGMQNFYVNKDGSVTATSSAVEPDGVLEDLLPFFWGDEAEVRKFLRKVEGAKAVDVVAEVNRLLAERKVSDKSCHKPLWEVLNKHGLYPRNLSNWNTQIQV